MIVRHALLLLTTRLDLPNDQLYIWNTCKTLRVLLNLAKDDMYDDEETYLISVKLYTTNHFSFFEERSFCKDEVGPR